MALTILSSLTMTACSRGDTPIVPPVQRLLGTCPTSGEGAAASEPHLTLGGDTRIAVVGRTPWRCEAPVEIGRDSSLTFALGLEPGAVLDLRVRLRADGREETVHEARVTPVAGGASWRDVDVDLSSLAGRQGTLLFEIASASGGATGFGFAEPVVVRPEPRRPNLVLVLLDTLRADRVGFGAGARDTTPFLAELARAGTVFTRAYSPSSWTRPSTASLMVGLDPAASGVHNGYHRIGRDQRTLALVLREAGWATTGFSRNPNVLPLYGFDRGFDRFVDAEAADWGRTTDTRYVIDLAIEELTRLGDRPFFLYLHLNQIHAPYLPPAAFRAGVTGDPPEPSDLYDADVRFVDAELRRLHDALRAAGREADTVWAVTADHGEEFGEHGRGSHGITLYEEQLRIPMLLWAPERVPAQVVERPVRLSALADTLLGVLDVDTSVAARQSLLAPSADDGPFIYSIEDTPRRVHAISDGRWKYIVWRRPYASEELYDLVADPGEQRNLVDEAPAEADRLAKALHRVLAHRRPGLHLRLASGAERRVQVVLGTTGRFEDVWTDDLEAGDRVVMSEDGTRLEIAAVLRPSAGFLPGVPRPGDDEPPAVSVREPDVDEIGFVVDPPGSAIELAVSSEVGGEPAVWVGAQQAAPPVRLKADAPELEVRAVPADETGGAVVWLHGFAGTAGVRRSAVPETSLEGPVPDDVRRRLRALGYMH